MTEFMLVRNSARIQDTIRSAVYTFLSTVKSIAADNTIDGTAVAKINAVQAARKQSAIISCIRETLNKSTVEKANRYLRLIQQYFD